MSRWCCWDILELQEQIECIDILFQKVIFLINHAWNDCIEKIEEANGIILGSPTYFSDVTSEMKALTDRAGFTAIANGFMFKRKVAAAVITVRRGGAMAWLVKKIRNEWFDEIQESQKDCQSLYAKSARDAYIELHSTVFDSKVDNI